MIMVEEMVASFSVPNQNKMVTNYCFFQLFPTTTFPRASLQATQHHDAFVALAKVPDISSVPGLAKRWTDRELGCV